MDHAKLLVQIRRLHKSGQVARLVVYLDVPADELRLDEVDGLEGDQQRDRHKVHDRDEPDADVVEALADHVRLVVVLVWVQVPVITTFILRPDRQDGRTNDRKCQLDSHGDHNEVVELLLILRTLDHRVSAILHDLCVVARVHARTDDPLGVPERAAFQQDLIRIDRKLTAVLQDKFPLESVEILVGPFAVNLRILHLLQNLSILTCDALFHMLTRQLLLHVSLAVQVFRFNVADASW